TCKAGRWGKTFIGVVNLSVEKKNGWTSIPQPPSSTLTITGGNTGANPGLGYSSVINTCEINFTHPSGLIIKFHWSYKSAVDPGLDPFGMLVDGAHITLATVNGSSGDVSVFAKSTFGWFINCTDCTSGAATAVIFFSSRRRHTRLVSDWSSDVCSSD